MDEDARLRTRWFPVTRCEEAIPRHIVQTQLLGQEIALWRDESGRVNAWENRCPHRGVRLSIGFNAGSELRCQYHGWRFAGGTGQCVYIPAHPDQKPANAIRATLYGCAESQGLVWVNLGASDAVTLPLIAGGPMTTLRGVFVRAPAPMIAAALAGAYAAFRAPDDFILRNAAGLTFLLQPLNGDETLIHGLLAQEATGAERLALLREHNARLNEIRDAVERDSRRAA